MPWYEKISGRTYLVIAVIMFALFAGILLSWGRVPICECGYIKLWHGIVKSSENSQHIADWYSFSHIIHGFAFFLLFWWVGKRWSWPLGARFIAALALEMGWELFENTNFIINRYRSATISLDYFGDSVINSVFDVLFMAFGFYLARKLPIWVIITLTLAFELFVGWYIRDNLTLNIIMLIHPFRAILNWQAGV